MRGKFDHSGVGAEANDSAEVASVVSEDLEIPTEGIDLPDAAESDLFDDESLLDSDACIPRKNAAGTLSQSQQQDLATVISDSCLSTELQFENKLPWELPGMDLVFGDNDELPKLPVPIFHSVPLRDKPEKRPLDTGATVYKKPERGSFLEVIDFGLTMKEIEIEEHRWARALEKWLFIFSSGPTACPQGCDFDQLIHDRSLQDIRIHFGSRSPLTVMKRGNSLAKFLNWFRECHFLDCPFPLTSFDIETYLKHLSDRHAAPSAFSGFIEAVLFSVHVVGIPWAPTAESPLLISPTAKKFVEMADMNRKEKKQSRVLTVNETRELENLLSDELETLVDRAAAGVMLFCLHSRSRWSDIRKVFSYVGDFNLKAEKISGYIEFKTRTHKTARLTAKQGLSMPLVAPVWGVSAKPWGVDFVQVMDLNNRALASIQNEPLLLAPDESGSWMERSVSTQEASRWLDYLLSKRLGSAEKTSIHSLKATPLSWCAKFGVSLESRLLLGHHSSGKGSAETYARDSLAKPLRDYEEVLSKIRTGSFSPDHTRSGMLSEPIRKDPATHLQPSAAAHEPMEDKQAESSSTSSSSGSSSTSSSESEAPAPELPTRNGQSPSSGSPT